MSEDLMTHIPRRRLAGIPCAALAFGICACWIARAANPILPQPCAPGACGSKGPSQFVTAGTATAVATQNTLKINQTTQSAAFNWSSFNIGKGDSVIFKQPNSSAVALNRIFENSPVQIFGNLTANGQVYLINLNGFLFGPTASVNVGSLLVS